MLLAHEILHPAHFKSATPERISMVSDTKLSIFLDASLPNSTKLFCFAITIILQNLKIHLLKNLQTENQILNVSGKQSCSITNENIIIILDRNNLQYFLWFSINTDEISFTWTLDTLTLQVNYYVQHFTRTACTVRVDSVIPTSQRLQKSQQASGEAGAAVGTHWLISSHFCYWV